MGEAEAKNTIVAVLNDLMFQVRIQDAAKRAGLRALFVKSQAEALTLARQHPALVVLDLNYTAASPLDLISELKADEQTRNVPLFGYVSHIQTDLRKQAAERGCEVLARSVFVERLAELLEQHAVKG